MKRIPISWLVVMVVALWTTVAIGVACRHAPPPTKVAPMIPKAIEKVAPMVLPCMKEPPKMVVIGWPTPDRMGNRILAASMYDLIVDTMVAERRYIDENWAACQDMALEQTIWKERP